MSVSTSFFAEVDLGSEELKVTHTYTNEIRCILVIWFFHIFGFSNNAKFATVKPILFVNSLLEEMVNEFRDIIQVL